MDQAGRRAAKRAGSREREKQKRRRRARCVAGFCVFADILNAAQTSLTTQIEREQERGECGEGKQGDIMLKCWQQQLH